MLFLPFLQEHFKKNIGHSHICLPLLFLLYSKKNCKGGFDMPYTVFISLGISVVLLFLSLIFRLAGKLRLTLPLLYFLLTATVLNPWAAAHETLAFAILYGLLALSVISWLFSLRNAIRDRRYYKALEEDMSWQIKRARNNGIAMDTVYFDSTGNMRYKDTNEVVD